VQTGIYEILNTANGKWYRGQTQADYGFEGRWAKHRSKLNRGKHDNEHLQNAWNKYGEEAFRFTVLSRCAPEFCNELEEYWIGDDYNNRNISYNKQVGGAGGSISDDAKKKISDAQIGRPKSESTKLQFRQALGHHFRVSWPDGRVKEYYSTTHASEDPDVNISHRMINGYLRGTHVPGKTKRTAHLKGCTFTYTKEQS
jgi:group I intron endonuclease